MGWTVVDACDYVKPTATQLREMFTLTEKAAPLHKAYNTYENPAMSFDQRM